MNYQTSVKLMSKKLYIPPFLRQQWLCLVYHLQTGLEQSLAGWVACVLLADHLVHSPLPLSVSPILLCAVNFSVLECWDCKYWTITIKTCKFTLQFYHTLLFWTISIHVEWNMCIQPYISPTYTPIQAQYDKKNSLKLLEYFIVLTLNKAVSTSDFHISIHVLTLKN